MPKPRVPSTRAPLPPRQKIPTNERTPQMLGKSTNASSFAPPLPKRAKLEHKTMDNIVKDLHLSEDYSDMTIICGDKTFKAHRLVVCSQSEYFQKACCGNFKEAHEPIRFPDKSPVVMEKVLEYFSAGDYTLNPEAVRYSERSSSNNIKGRRLPSSAARPVVLVDNSSSATSVRLSRSTWSSPVPVGSNEGDIEPSPTENPAFFHAQMYGEGDYLFIEGLKTKAQANFTTDLTKILTKADPKTAALDKTLEELYSTRANYYSLRSIAIRQIVEHIHVVSVKHGIPLRKSMKSIPDFAFDLCMALMRERCSLKSYPEVKPSQAEKAKLAPKTPAITQKKGKGTRNQGR